MRERVSVAPGDDLWTPFTRRLRIGNLASQLFGNIYLDGMDHFVREVLRAPGYVRYVDDFALFADDPLTLQRYRERLGVWLAGRRLMLHLHKTRIDPSALPTEFLGLVLSPRSRRLPAANVASFRRRLGALRDRWRSGSVTEAEVRHRVGAWLAHAAHANTDGLRRTLFRAGWFASPVVE